MRKSWLVLSLVLMFIGLCVGYIYGNPFGFVIDGIGFVIFLYAVFVKQEETGFVSRKQYLRSTHQEDYRCGRCFWFGKPGCERNENLINAEPCENYKRKYYD